jgi:hypothetical protein
LEVDASPAGLDVFVMEGSLGNGYLRQFQNWVAENCGSLEETKGKNGSYPSGKRPGCTTCDGGFSTGNRPEQKEEREQGLEKRNVNSNEPKT